MTFADRGPGVYFRDARKFGKVQWLAPGARSERLDKLGVDALSATGEDLHRAARKRIVHPNKAARAKSRLTAFIGKLGA